MNGEYEYRQMRAREMSWRRTVYETSCTVCRIMPNGSLKDLTGVHWANAHQAITGPQAAAQHLQSEDHVRRANDGRMRKVPLCQRHPEVLIRGRPYSIYTCRCCSLTPGGRPRQRSRNISEETLLDHMASEKHEDRWEDGRFQLWLEWTNAGRP
jgi:hypothetical protein